MVSTALQNFARLLWRWGASPCTAPGAPARSHDSAATGRSLKICTSASFFLLKDMKNSKAKGAFSDSDQLCQVQSQNKRFGFLVHKWFRFKLTCPKVPALPILHTCQKSWSSLSTPQSLSTRPRLQAPNDQSTNIRMSSGRAHGHFMSFHHPTSLPGGELLDVYTEAKCQNLRFIKGYASRS